jgi:hypothetical protein
VKFGRQFIKAHENSPVTFILGIIAHFQGLEGIAVLPKIKE